MKADGKCGRCQGKGFRDCFQAHLGVPGLCFDCDGDGTYATQAAKKAAAKRQNKLTAKQFAIRDELNALAEKHGGTCLRLDKEKRNAFPWYEPFTTAQWAEKFGISKKEAFIELVRAYPRCHVAYDAEANPVGWMFG